MKRLQITDYRLKIFLGVLISVIVLTIFFTYRILQVPPGIEEDEAAIGYNATLIARTLHDENGRLLPFFILSNHHVDWHQPVTVYITAVLFKIFGPSYFLLRFTSLLFFLVSFVLLFYLLFSIQGLLFAILGSTIYVLTPIMMIQSHMGIENISLVPFEILWLIGIWQFLKTKRIWYLILSGISLGIAFYSYKSMRLIVPVYVLLSIGLLSWDYIRQNSVFVLSLQAIKKSLKTSLPFILALLPFFIIIPILELKYPGAVFDRKGLQFIPYYDFFYGFFANLDPSFLFIKGDSTFYHSTGRHGEMLLATVPVFFLGVYQIIRKRQPFFMFILLSFFLTPLLFSLPGSVFRASRLLAYVPLYAIIAGVGLLWLWENKAALVINKLRISLFALFLALMIFNYIDFVEYYWFEYARFATQYFSDNSHDSYLKLSQESSKRNLTPYVEDGIFRSDGLAGNFFDAAYFDNNLKIWKSGTNPPPESILMTNEDSISGMQQIQTDSSKFKLFVPSQ